MAELLRVEEFAAEVNVRPATVRAWILYRKICVVRVGGRAVRIPRSEVARLIQEGTCPAVDRHERMAVKR